MTRLALGVFLGASLALTASALRLHDFLVGDDLGGLPGGGNGGSIGLVDHRPNLFLEGRSAEQLLSMISSFNGTFTIFEEPIEGGVRWVVSGSDYALTVDEDEMLTSSIKMGIAASDIGGSVLARLEWQDVLTSAVVIPEGHELDLSFERLQDTGILDQTVVARTLFNGGEQGELMLHSGAGVLTIKQQ